jgi:hypothetical protein
LGGLSVLLKGDIVKIVCPNKGDKLGLISDVVDDRMVLIGKNWFDLQDCEVTLLHRES